MRVDVTQDDIDRGRPRVACACPIAKAVERCCGYEYVLVGHRDVRGYRPGDVRRIVIPATPLPSEAAAFVRDFDAGRSVSPFSFDLEVEPCGSK